MQWLFEAKKRYGLVILNYAVTSNHIHLIAYDSSDQNVIPRSMQLVAVGSESFVDKIKKKLKALAIGRRIVSTTDGWELREEASSYNPFFEGQKVDIDHENTYPWEEIATISMC